MNARSPIDVSVAHWQPVCRLEELPVLGARRWLQGPEPIAVFRNAQDQVFALLDRCPHKGGPLSQGIVFGQSVACPLHNWTIGLCDGVAAAPDVGCTPKFAVRVVDGDVQLDAHELATLGVDLAVPVAGPQRRAAHAG